MAKDAKGHGSDARGGPASYQNVSDKPLLTNAARDRLAAHAQGVDQVGAQPKVLPPESPESRELRLFADNDANLYRQSMQPIRDNLGKKMDKGVYDPEKAQTLYKYHADRAAQAYGEQHGSGRGSGKQMFSPAVRREAAAHWEADERDDIKSGSSRSYKGK